MLKTIAHGPKIKKERKKERKISCNSLFKGRTVPDGKKSGVSSPIRSIKCTVVFNVLCKKETVSCRNMLAHVELDPTLSPLGRAGCLSHLQGADCLSPLSQEGVLPLSLISLAIGDLVY
jgi:hypothetical protein